MMFIIVLILSTVLMASHVYCVRQPPANFFQEYDEKNCIKLNHVTSHINHRENSAVSLDMICKSHDVYYLASFASPQPIVVPVRKEVIRIAKVEHNVTVITFVSLHNNGQATLYFESVEDAKNFSRDVYPLLKGKLKHFQRLGKIEKTTKSTKSPVAAHFADIYYEAESKPIKFVIEADGNPEPALVFLHKEFQIMIDKDENVHKAILKLGGASIYEVYFDTVEERSDFVERIYIYIGLRELLLD